MAERRGAAYNCPPIDQLGLTTSIARAVIDELVAMIPQFQNDSTSQPDNLLGVPWVSQIDQNSPDSLDCGQACVLMLLKYYDNPPSPAILSNTTVNDLVELMRVIDVQKGRPRRADNLTNGQDLVDLSGANGLQVIHDAQFSNLNKVIDLLHQRRPVILLVNYHDLQFPLHLQSGTDQGMHWLVVIGYSDHGQAFIVHDPLWTPAQRNGRGGGHLQISRVNLENARRLNWAVY
jgi:hypothetical protein